MEAFFNLNCVYLRSTQYNIMVKRNWKIIFVAISQIFDIIAIFLTRIIVKYIFVGYIDIYDPRFYFPAIAVTIIYVLIASMLGLYRGSFHLSLRLQNFIMFRSYVMSVLVANSVILFSGLFYQRTSLAAFFIVLPIALLVARILLKQLNLYFQRLGYGIHETLIVGFNGETKKEFSRFSVFPELGYRVRGLVVDAKNEAYVQVPQYYVNELEALINQYAIDRIFIPADRIHLKEYERIENVSRRLRVKVKIVSNETEQLLKLSKIYDIAGITIFAPIRYKISLVKRISKRLFDFVLSVIITVILLPVFFVTALAIFIESGRPIFFLQERTSHKNGRRFNFIKFRSMVSNAEELKSELEDKNESDGALFKMKDDPRVTKIGRVLRKLSIDELPQLFNVVIGDMSLVGPRPLPPIDFDKANESEEFWNVIKDRASVKPGMTGLWQISGRSDIKFKEMILLDLYYIENSSLLFDMEILFETIPVVLFGRGAY